MGILSFGRIIVKISSAFFPAKEKEERIVDENSIKTAVVYSCIRSYRRFCGFFCSKFMVMSSNEEDNLNEIWVNFEADHADRILLKKRSSMAERIVIPYEDGQDNPLHYVKLILYGISNQYKELGQSVDFFLNNKLWLLELQWRHLSENEIIRREIGNRMNRILMELDKNSISRFENQQMNYLCDYLKVMQADLVCKQYKQRYGNSSAVKDYLARTFREIARDEQYYSDDPLFLELLCRLSEHLEDNRIVIKNYTLYLEKLIEAGIDTHWEQSKAYYYIGHYYEHLDVGIKEKKIYNCLFGKSMNENMLKAVQYYNQAFRKANENYRAEFKIILTYDPKSDEILDGLQNLRNKLKEEMLTGLVDMTVLIYLFKILYHIGVLKMEQDWEMSDVIDNFKEAEQLYDDVIQPYYCYMAETQNEIENDLLALRENLKILLLYSKLTSAYMQSEGIYSKEGNRYEKKYFDLKI